MPIVLRRPTKPAKHAAPRPRFANGGVATDQSAKRRLPPDVYADALDDRVWRYDPADGRVKMEMKPSARPTPQPQPARGLPPSVQAALDAGNNFARGGAVGLPQPLFSAAPLPSVATPGLASPRGLVGAHHRQHFADGGLPHHVLAALGLRPHFLDGGSAGGGDGDGEGSSRSGGSSGGGDNGGDGHGNSGDSSSSSGSAGGVGGFGGSSSGDGYGGGSSSGSSGGVGGFGGGSSDGYGGGSSSSSSSTSSGGGFSVGSSGSSNSSTSSSSGSAGGVGGFGGGSSDGYGGGSSSSSSSSNSSSGSAGGVGGFGGGSSDGYGGGSSGGTQSSGGFSSGAASGSDSGGVGGSVGSGGVMGGGGLSGSSVGSGDVGSMGGSYGAPSAGGFSNSGDMSGGFGGFGSGPAANDTSGGMTGATPSASMMSGYTAGQSMANEAANSAGAPGEDGTGGGLSGVSTAGSFGSFGLGPSSPSSPFGGMDNARSAFGASTDGTTGTTPSSVGMSNPDAVAGLSPSGQMMGVMGMGGMDPGLAGAMNVGTAGALTGPGAFGLSTMNRDASMPGFDNFGAQGNVTQSSLGADGYGGTDLGSVNPAGSYTTPSGVQSGEMTGALQGGLPSAEGYVGSYAGLSPNVPASVAAAIGNPGPDAQTAQPAEAYHGVSPAVLGGMLGDIGDVFGGFTSPSPATVPASPYGTMSQTPMGPLNVGSLQQAMSTDRTSDTAGINADGDPTAVNGTSALTIHGNLSPFSGATVGDLSPSAQTMSLGTPAPNVFGGQPAMAGPDATEAAHQYLGTQLGRRTGVGTFGNDYDGQGFAQTAGYTDFAGNNLSGLGTPSAITDSQVMAARQNLQNGTGTDQDKAVVAGYLAQQNGTQQPGLGTPSLAGDTTATAPSALTVRGLPQGQDFSALHAIEGGVLNGQPDPNNPGHYGPAQFSQDTFSDTARAHPELGIGTGMSMFNSTPDQYAAATQAHWNDIGAALTKAGLPDTPGNRYAGWNLGVTGGIRALSAGPDASLAQAGISADVQASNPSIYGGVQTVGQLQAKLAGMFSGATNSAGPPSSQAPTGLGLGTPAPGTFSPSGVSFGQPGEDSAGDEPTAAMPAPAAAPVTRTITTPAPYGVSPDVASSLTVNGLAPTPANALAADTLGVANGIAVMNGPPGDPISSVDISPETVQAHPDLFSGVRTIGDLQANIAAAAPTAGTTTSTVTDPSAPAQPSTLTISPGPRAATPFSGYSGTDGTSPSFGLNTMSAGVPATINNAGTYGVPSGVGVGQDAQNLAGFSQVPSSLPTLARGTVASPGFSPEAGFSTSDTSAPSAGISFNGPAAPADGTSDPTTPDGAPAKHLSVPNWAGNGAAGIAAGSLLGPVGSLLGMGNTISGWMGGPTAADGINAALAHPGAPTGVTGGGDNSSQPGSDHWGSSMPAPVYAPGGGGSGSSSPSTASSGVSPYDPHAAAMAAYNAALAGMGKGTGSGTSGASSGPRPLLIRGRPVRQAAPPPLYKPMEDPIVRRALGLE